MAISELGFGAAPLGNLFEAISEEQAHATVTAAWDGGVRYFDTAPHYGLGLSERRLGQVLAERPRDEFVVSTKVGRMLDPNPAPTGSDLAAGGFAVPDDLVRRFDFTADGVRRSLESSLTRLGMDRIDIVYVHDPDDHVDTAITEALPALLALRDEGVIGAVGVGMIQWQAPLRMVRECELDVVMLASRWTLIDRSGEPLLAECADRGVSVVAAAPYNSGLLARDRPPPDALYEYGPAPADLVERVNRLADVCESHGTRLPVAALQFPLRHPAVRSVVAGVGSPAHAASAVERYAAEVPDEVWAELG